MLLGAKSSPTTSRSVQAREWAKPKERNCLFASKLKRPDRERKSRVNGKKLAGVVAVGLASRSIGDRFSKVFVL